jgi:hypothetical protein
MAPPAMLAITMAETGDGSKGLGTVLTVLAIIAVISLCLWLFFRRGSINDRAEVDAPVSDLD